MKNKFRVLKHNKIFVNETMIGNGIYKIGTPTLYSEGTTIETIIRAHKSMQKYTGMSDEYIKMAEENLMKCKMIDVELIEQ